jgi:hypothetical protein
MRLTEYIQQSNARMPPKDTLLTLPGIQWFAFGKSYTVQINDGGMCSYDFTDLDDMLAVVQGEFEAFPEYKMRIVLQARSTSQLGSASQRELIVFAVTGKQAEGYKDGILLQQIEMIRQSVTMYNLTQTWDQFNKGNL